ncbi:MAG: hypothetical protein M3422_24280, partial [Actinomycetota bacterium]|nr:hypothetical protein [Actinomycetota bacterium]
MAPHLTVVALDVRGLTTALADWLRATGPEGALLLANSAGCQIVVDPAEHAPDTLGPAVLTGPTTDPHRKDPLRQLARLLADIPRERPTLLPLLARDYRTRGPRRFLGDRPSTAQHAPWSSAAPAARSHRT